MKTESPQLLPLDSETIRDASGQNVPVADRLAEYAEEMIALSKMEGDFLSNVAAVLPGVTPLATAAANMAVDMAHHRTRRVRNAGMRGLSQLAAAGNNLARYNLGLWHLAGKVAEPDFSMGLSLLEVVAATEKEDLYFKGLANRSMADCYSHGVGVEADPGRAAEFNERAAELGVADAAFNLALYHDPKGSDAENRTPDYVKAAKFYQRAADLGHVPAMTNLGILYVSGLAQEPTPGAGRALLARAGELGDEFAVEARAIFGSICPF